MGETKSTNYTDYKSRVFEGGRKIVVDGKAASKKVLIGAAVVGAVYVLGASKGVKIGHARGLQEGYIKATHDIAELIRQSVTVKAD